MTAAAVRTLLVEDHAMLRRELRELVTRSPYVGEVVEAATFRQAMETRASSFGLLLLDISLPDGDGPDLIPYFRSHNPEAKVLVFTVHQSEVHTLQAIESGADGYVMKDDPDLLGRIDQVMNGRNPVDSRVAGYLLERFRSAHSGPVELTPREQQTLSGLARGMRYDELAAHMQVSVHTVPGYIKSLYRKLDAHSRGEAVYKASQMGLLSLPSAI